MNPRHNNQVSLCRGPAGKSCNECRLRSSIVSCSCATAWPWRGSLRNVVADCLLCNSAFIIDSVCLLVFVAIALFGQLTAAASLSCPLLLPLVTLVAKDCGQFHCPWWWDYLLHLGPLRVNGHCQLCEQRQQYAAVFAQRLHRFSGGPYTSVW